MASKATGKNDNFRRTWDKDEYEKKAKERLQELEDDDEPSSSSQRREAPIKRKLLKKREYEVDLESNLGKSVVITKSSTMSQSGGYYCNVCDCIVKDSINFLDHINGKKHQRNLGMSMRVERSTLDQVKKRFELNKRKREEEKQTADYDLDERVAILKEEEEQRKQQRKDYKREKKLKTQDQDSGVDPDMAAMMGFSGFGSSKK
ncbi:zinc finger matrin-type protein 2 [Exaiptasia diaphana]|uniref:Matrin-type domain-containing protein n=1 Tax=Exaiptasia diaphana TaxID=2652724 RepID=A0A913XLJ0_EXADI|nr:zinc finger matrin-type protein 2 [Exaiptasia diaphana]KXJ29566.1 Zinc finger matrin-type protein 2 [Exaiptasia diaphana]